jgi:hypothetical protein
VIHQILEEAASGRFWPEVTASINTRWEELVADAERKMEDSWLERHLVPLQSSVPSYEVRMRVACARAVEMSQRVGGGNRDLRPDRDQIGSELWVENTDRSVGGRIDRIEASPAGPIIQDFKSGRITEESTTRGQQTLIVDYESQLRLYAALYAEQTGKWPAALELVPLDGVPVRIDVDRASCLALLDDAVAIRARVNRILASFADRADEAEQRLANPSLASCGHCSYRPACAAYWRARSLAPSENWLKDLSGTALEIRTLGNSKLTIAVCTGEAGAVTARVVGIGPQRERHPALEHLKPGDRIILLNLRQGAGASTYSETQVTAIYKLIAPVATEQLLGQ